MQKKHLSKAAFLHAKKHKARRLYGVKKHPTSEGMVL